MIWNLPESDSWQIYAGKKCVIPVFVRKYFSRIKVQERDREYTKKHIQELPVFLYWKNEKLQRLFSGI